MLRQHRIEHLTHEALAGLGQLGDRLAQADTGEPMGLRNRAILEVFYSCGIRRLELIGLKLYDVDVERGMLMVRQGKAARTAPFRSASALVPGWRATSTKCGRTWP